MIDSQSQLAWCVQGQVLKKKRKKDQCHLWGSNSRPSDYETDALPTAPRRHLVVVATKIPLSTYSYYSKTSCTLIEHAPLHDLILHHNIAWIREKKEDDSPVCWFYLSTASQSSSALHPQTEDASHCLHEVHTWNHRTVQGLRQLVNFLPKDGLGLRWPLPNVIIIIRNAYSSSKAVWRISTPETKECVVCWEGRISRSDAG